MVELAMLAAAHMGDQAVEDHAVLLILIQPEVQEMAQETPALRHAKAIGVLEVACAGVALPRGAILEK